MTYRYPDQADAIPTRAIRATGVIQGMSWEEADLAVLRQAAALLGTRRPLRIADIGAGPGRLMPVAASLADHVVLVDPDAERLAAAEREAKRLGILNCTFVNQDLAGFSSSGQAFDLVLCSHVLQHVATGARAVFCSSLARITAAGGLLVLTFPCTSSGHELFLLTSPAEVGRPRTVTVGPAEFDASVAGCWDAASGCGARALPVWHSAPGQVDELLRECGIEVVARRPYREFEFEVAAGPGPATPAIRAATDTVILARRAAP